MTSKENQASTDFSTLALSPATLANLQQLGYTHDDAHPGRQPAACAGWAKTSSPRPAPAAAKPPPLPWPCWPTSTPAASPCRPWCCAPRASWPTRSTAEIRRLARAEGNIKVVTLCGGVPLRGQIAEPGARRAHRGGRHPGASWTTWSAAPDARQRSTPWCSTRPTACWTWASSTTSSTVARQCPEDRQTLLFSATYPEGIAKLSAAVHAPARSRSRCRPSMRPSKIRAALVRGEEQRAPACGGRSCC